MLTFGELVLAEKRLSISKNLNKIVDYYATLENPILRDFSEKIYLNLENLTGGLVQKLSNEHNLTEVCDISLRYLLKNFNEKDDFTIGKVF